MFFEVLGLTYHSPITIESLTCRVFRIRIRTRPGARCRGTAARAPAYALTEAQEWESSLLSWNRHRIHRDRVRMFDRTACRARAAESADRDAHAVDGDARVALQPWRRREGARLRRQRRLAHNPTRPRERRRTGGIPLQRSHGHSGWLSGLDSAAADSERKPYMSTSYSAIPLNGSSNANLSELPNNSGSWRGIASSRASWTHRFR